MRYSYRLAQLQAQNVPAVAIVRRAPGDVIDTVVFEDHAGAYAATRHLLSLGHRDIAFIGGDIDFSSNHSTLAGIPRGFAGLRRTGGRRARALEPYSMPPGVASPLSISSACLRRQLRSSSPATSSCQVYFAHSKCNASLFQATYRCFASTTLIGSYSPSQRSLP